MDEQPVTEPVIEMMECNHQAVTIVEATGATADIALENLDETIREQFRRWQPIYDVGIYAHRDEPHGPVTTYVASVRMVRPVTLHRWRDPIADAF